METSPTYPPPSPSMLFGKLETEVVRERWRRYWTLINNNQNNKNREKAINCWVHILVCKDDFFLVFQHGRKLQWGIQNTFEKHSTWLYGRTISPSHCYPFVEQNWKVYHTFRKLHHFNDNSWNFIYNLLSEPFSFFYLLRRMNCKDLQLLQMLYIYIYNVSTFKWRSKKGKEKKKKRIKKEIKTWQNKL